VKLSSQRVAAIAVAASLALAACGGDDDDADVTAPTVAPATDPASPATDPASPATDPASPATDPAAPATDPAVDTPEIDYAGLTGELVGGGASAQGAAIEAWKAGFGELAPNVTISYDTLGSGGGRSGFLDGSFDFAGSDAALSEDEIATSIDRCAGDQGAINLPHYISPIAVAYNLPELDGAILNLTPEAVAGIFAGEITNWNDAAIADANPGVELPDRAINPVHRADKSGTSKNFTAYLEIVAPDIWTWGDIEDWEVEGPAGGEGANGTSGVVAAIQAGEGSIGYADASQIEDLAAAAVGVGGEFVPYSAAAAAAVVDASPRLEGRHEFDFSYDLKRDLPGTYPIVLVSYHIVCLQYADQAKADAVRGFLTYVASPEGQEAAAANAGSAPISDEVRAQLLEAIGSITAG